MRHLAINYSDAAMRSFEGPICASKALQHTGYIGAFQVDYRDNRIRGNGRSGSYFWLLKKKMADGVPLKDLDSAYHIEDLEHIIEMRANFRGRGGRYENRFRVKNPFSDGYAHVHAAFTVIVDPYGTPVSAEGAFFDVTSLLRKPTRPSGSVISLAPHIRARSGLLSLEVQS